MKFSNSHKPCKNHINQVPRHKNSFTQHHRVTRLVQTPTQRKREMHTLNVTRVGTYYDNYDKMCILCVCYGLSTPPDIFLDHVGGVYADLCVYFVIFIRIYYSKLSKYIIIMYIKIIEIKNYVFDQNIIFSWLLRIKCHTWCGYRSDRRCVDGFMYLFYRFIRFYYSKYM